MLRIALRAHRTGFLVVAVLGFALAFVEGVGFAAAAGHTAAERAAFGKQMVELAPQIAYLVPLPIHPETLAGYVQWRTYGTVSIVFGFWALMAASGAIRNEEERGLMETWLASAVGRLQLVAARFAAFTTAAAAAAFVTALGTPAAAAAIGDSVGAAPLTQVSIALLGLTLVCFAIGLLAAQLVATRRGAAALGGATLLALFFVDSLSRVRPSAADWSWLSPFALYDRTTVVAPGGRFDVPATAALFAAAAGIAALSAAGFRLRDVGAPLMRRRRAGRRSVRTPSANPLLRVPVLSALWEQRMGLLAWLLGSVVLAAFLLSIATSTNEMLRSTPNFQGYFRAGGTDDPALLLVGLFWFGLAAFMMAVYASTQVGRWAADDAEGRLEMTIAQPVPRWRVVAERGLTLTAASALIAAAGTLVVAELAPSQGVHLRPDRLLLATALLVPLALSFGALGAAITARLPRLALPVLAAIAVAGYFVQQLGPLFRWPDWALDLSLFQLYGNPLISGVFWTGLYAMVGIVLIGFGIGVAAMRVREVGR